MEVTTWKRRRSTGGFTVVEGLLASVLFTLVLAMVHQLWSGSTRAADGTVEIGQAMHSVMVATEFLRFDLGRAMVHGPQSAVQVEEDGRKLTFTISGDPPADLTKFAPVKVTYFLEGPAGPGVSSRLMRQSGGSLTFLKECSLSEFLIRFVPRGAISDHQAYVEISLCGTSGSNSQVTFVTSQLVPVGIAQDAVPYSLIPAGGGA